MSKLSKFTANVAALSKLPAQERVRVLELTTPRTVVEAALRQTGHDRRHCGRLPPAFMAYFVVALGLFTGDSHRAVFKHLERFRRGCTPARNTIAEARKGLGVAPRRLIAAGVVQLLGTPDTPGAFYKGWRLMASDGFVIDLPDTPANERAFGRPNGGRAAGAFPQARVLALCETGSHVYYRWQIKPLCRGETGMAGVLLRHLRPDMLLLWDRNFLSFHNVEQVKRRQAQLLARIKAGPVFEPTKVLEDGSYLSKIYPASWYRQRDRGGIEVRIIEYTLWGTGHAEEGKAHRLLTTLLDAKEHPAQELIVLYHERWEEELAIDELKTHLKEKPELRPKTPAGVVQEMEGLLLAHYVVRKVMHQAAEREGLDPDRLSFTATLKILRCRLPEAPCGANNTAARRRWWQALLAEVGEEVLPERRQRVSPRVIKRKMSKWQKKRPCHRKPPQPTKPFRECIIIT